MKPTQTVRLIRAIIGAVFLGLTSANIQWWLQVTGLSPELALFIQLPIGIAMALNLSRYVDMAAPCEHDWKVVFDWTGDPGVIGGTQDFSYRECRLCGEQDHETPIEPHDEQPGDWP